MSGNKIGEDLTRSQLLKNATAAGATFAIGSGFLSAKDAAWAIELSELKPNTFATLVQMARDICTHDRIGDEYHVIASNGYDSPD